MTEFYLATKSQEFKACHEILDKLARRAAFPLSFPTIIGKRGDRIIAFVSTRPVKKAKAVVLGELAVDPAIERPIFVIVKMLEVYDAFLYKTGVTSYLSCVSVNDKKFIEVMRQAAGIEPYAQDSKWAWFNRRIA